MRMNQQPLLPSWIDGIGQFTRRVRVPPVAGAVGAEPETPPFGRSWSETGATCQRLLSAVVYLLRFDYAFALFSAFALVFLGCLIDLVLGGNEALEVFLSGENSMATGSGTKTLC